MMESRNDDWIRKMMEEGLSEEEGHAIKEGLDKEDQGLFDQLEKIKETSGGFDIKGSKSKEEAWMGLMEKMGEESIESVTKTVPFYQRPTVISWTAACIALIVAVFFFIDYFGEKHIYIARAKRDSVILPDESHMVVNAHSTVIYNERHFDEERTIRLDGEAYFDVREGTPFKVVTKLGTIKVLGTRFNVLNRNREFQVKCMEGEVEVKLDNNMRSVKLIEGQATKLEDYFLVDPYLVEVDKMSAWREGDFYFDGDPLSLVIQELENQFDVQIKAEDIQNRYYTGHFSSDNFEEALELVMEPMGLEYDIIDKRLVIVR